MVLRNIFQKLKANWKYPGWWSELLLSGYYYLRGNDGDNVLEYDWNNLVILDACSCEAFLREFTRRYFGKEAGCRTSNATCTLEFLMRTFTDEYYPDIIYLTGNPYPSMVFKNKFYKMIHVWAHEWDNKLGTVPPEGMLKATLLALKKYPNKKLIIHFMQPHFPYVNLPSFSDGSLDVFREKVLTNGKNRKTISPKLYRMSFINISSSPIYLMGTRDDHLKGYFYNLRRTLDVVERLLKVLPGRTLVTADHGDAFGEIVHPFLPIRIYGHPWNIRIDVLKKVPLFIHTNEEFSPPEYSRKNYVRELYHAGIKKRQNRDLKLKRVINRLKLERKL